VDNILEVEHLSVHFGAVEVLKDLSFQVGTGNSLAVIGPNGAGKTVLFQALIGSVPSDGMVRWAPDIRIGYIPQKLDIERDVERDVPVTGMDLLRARASLARGSDSDVPRDIAYILDLVVPQK
jgi:zinc transport system ATP-binding protein